MPKQSKSALSRTIGQQAEQAAAKHLLTLGCQLISQNFYSRFGEIDLIIIDQHVLAFVEVKARSNSAFGAAAATVTPAKQRKIIQTAQHFLSTRPEFNNYSMRFDVVTIALASEQNAHKQPLITWLKDAYRADGF